MTQLDLLLSVARATTVALMAVACGHVLLKRRPEAVPTLALAGLLTGCVLLALTGADWPAVWHASISEPAPEATGGDSTGTAGEPKPARMDIALTLEHVRKGLQQLSAQSLQSSAASGAGLVLGSVLLLALARIGCGLFATCRLHRSSRIVTDGRLSALTTTSTVDGPGLVELVFRVTDRVDSPCVSFLDSNCVYLPEQWTTYSDDELAASVAHETAHLQRSDAKLRLLAQLTTALQVFHPLSHFLLRQLVIGQELAADRMAAQVVGRHRFLRGISQLALRLDADALARRSPGIGVSHSSSFLTRRITMLRNGMSEQTRGPASLLVRAPRLAVVATGVALASWTLCADEPIRVAARTTAQSTVTEAGLRSEPWHLIPGRAGYWSVNLETARRDPVMTQWLSQADALFLTAGWSFVAREDARDRRPELGLSLNNISQIAGDIVLTTERIDDPDSEHRFHSKAISNEFVFHFATRVEWAAVASSLAEDRLDKAIAGLISPEFPEEAAQPIIERDIIADFLSRQRSPQRFQFTKDVLSADGSAEERPATPPAIPQLWRAHQGVLATLVATLPDTTGGGETAYEKQVDEFHQLAEHYVLSINLSDEPGHVGVRLGFTPRGQTTLKELRTAVASVMQTTIRELRKRSDTDEPEAAMLRLFEDAAPEIVKVPDSNAASAVVIRADIPLAALQWLAAG